MTLASHTDVRIAVLDDWQKAAAQSADWSALQARAEIVFFEQPFLGQDEAAQALASFDIVMAMRERTPFPMALVERLPRLRMFALTGARAALIDIAGMVERGITVCTTGPGPGSQSTNGQAVNLAGSFTAYFQSQNESPGNASATALCSATQKIYPAEILA